MNDQWKKIFSTDIIYFYIIFVVLLVIVFIVMILFFIYLNRKIKNKKKTPRILGKNEPKKQPMFSVMGLKYKLVSFFNLDEVSKYFKKIISVLKKENDLHYNFSFILMIGKYTETKRNLFKHPEFNFPYADDIAPGIDNLFKLSIIDNSMIVDIDQDIFIPKDKTKNYKEKFRSILKAMILVKESKPLSSIMIRIPISEFKKRINESAIEKKEKIHHLATQYQKNLSLIQNITGLKIPVYLLITEIESMYGFYEFSSLLDDEEKKEILGWSNPYALESLYRESYFDEAIYRIEERVKFFILSKIALLEETPCKHDIYNFSYELISHLNEFRDFVNVIFSNKSFDNSYTLRGIYLCGFEENFVKLPYLIEENDIFKVKNIAPHEYHNNILFLNNLFINKIINELNIASPTYNYFLSSKKYALFPKIALPIVAMSLSINLFYYSYNLSIFTKDIQNNLINFKDFIDKKLVQKKKNDLSNEISLKNIVNLYNGLSEIKNHDIRNILYPISYISSFNYELEFCYSSITNFVLLKPIRTSLIAKNNKLLNEYLSKDKNINSAESYSKSIQDLYNFVNMIWTNENVIDSYNRMNLKISIQEVNRILSYILDADLKDVLPDYKFSYELNTDVVFEKIDLTEYKNEFNTAFIDIINTVSVNIQNDLTLKEICDSLIDILDNLKKYSEFNSSQYLVNKVYDKLVLLVDYTSSSMKKGSSTLPLKLQKTLDQLRVIIQKSDLLENDKNLALYDNALKEAFAIRFEKILDYTTKDFGPIFEKGKNNKTSEVSVSLSKAMLDLVKTIDDIRGQSFFEDFSSLSIPENLNVRNDFRWTERDLNDLNINLEKYSIFISENLKKIHPSFQELIKRLADQSVVSLTYNALIHSQENMKKIQVDLNDDEKMKDEIQDFNLDADRNIYILKNLYDIDAKQLYIPLSEAFLNRVALYFSFLNNRYLKKKAFYSFKDSNFNWWNGALNPAFEAFGANDISELQDYLRAQKEEISKIHVDLVDSLIKFVDFLGGFPNTYDTNRIIYWKNSIFELDNKAKDGVIVTLEDFILNGMTQLSFENCDVTLSKYSGFPIDNSIFAEKKRLIFYALKNQCDYLKENRFALEYNKFANYFNQEISGKFPFSRDLPKSSSDELEIEKFSEFVSYYNDFVNKVKFDNNISKNPSKNDSIEFLRNIGKIVKMFHLSNSKDENDDSLKLNFKVDLKLKKKREKNASSIIEREINIGNKKVSTTNRVKEFSWEFLDPISISFRWAKDIPFFPYTIQQESDPLFNIIVDNKKITYNFNNKWSIFALQKKYIKNASNSSQDQFISFNIPVKKEVKENGVEDSEDESAKVSMKISVLSTDKTLLSLPNFPVEAPQILMTKRLNIKDKAR